MRRILNPYLLVVATLILAIGTFSCQSDRIIPIERFDKSLDGKWEIGSMALKTSSTHEFMTTFVFEKPGLFDASNGKEIVWSGPYMISEPDDDTGNQYLILYIGSKSSKTYLIQEFTRNRLGIVPSEELGTGNVYYYERK